MRYFTSLGALCKGYQGRNVADGNGLSSRVAGHGETFWRPAVWFILPLNDHRKQRGFMAEYRPCPWCGVDVTTTAPLKIAPGVGSVPQSSPPGVFWDRNGGQQRLSLHEVVRKFKVKLRAPTLPREGKSSHGRANRGGRCDLRAADRR